MGIVGDFLSCILQARNLPIIFYLNTHNFIFEVGSWNRSPRGIDMFYSNFCKMWPNLWIHLPTDLTFELLSDWEEHWLSCFRMFWWSFALVLWCWDRGGLISHHPHPLCLQPMLGPYPKLCVNCLLMVYTGNHQLRRTFQNCSKYYQTSVAMCSISSHVWVHVSF